jgi:hypothetical protein
MYCLEHWDTYNWQTHSEHRSPSAALSAFQKEEKEQGKTLDRTDWRIVGTHNASWATCVVVA